MVYWCIYRITNNVNGKSYIGQHHYTNEDDPMKGYHGGGKLLHYAYKKYGRDNFTTEILYKRIQYKETADSMEIWMIEKERKSNPNGCYNIANGGRGSVGVPAWNKGKTISEWQKQRIREANKNKIVSEKTRQRISEGNKGKKRSEEQKKKVSEWSKQMWQNEEYRQRQIERAKNRRHSEETRKKMSEARKGRVVSDETKRKISEVHRGKKASEETRRKLSESHKGQIPWNKGKKGVYKYSEDTKRKMSNSHKGKNMWTKGKHWYNNGVECVTAFECPEGFVPGRIYRRKES